MNEMTETEIREIPDNEIDADTSGKLATALLIAVVAILMVLIYAFSFAA